MTPSALTKMSRIVKFYNTVYFLNHWVNSNKPQTQIHKKNKN